MERDFYGVVRTADHDSPIPYRSMYHGPIMHGGQLLGDSFRNTPADYFGPTSGYGRVFQSLREMRRKQTLSVGIIGLGAGVVAAWMQPGDALDFYEISPRVVDIARREFTFLADTAARTELVMGDGRLSLEREPPRSYDVLGIDAFSGDSIPMHLVTREAMAVYLKHIKPDGVIVFQATNRFINLLPVVRRLAGEFGLEAVNVADVPDAEEGAGAERHQAGAPHQGALREHDQRYAALGRLRELVGVLGALLHVEALDELRAQPHDEGARDKALAQLALGDEGVVAPGQDGEQHRAIEVAGVVRRNHHGAGRRQIFPAAHRQRDAAKPEKKPRAALRDLPGPLAGRNRGRGQDHDKQRAEKQPRVGGEQQPARDAPAAAQLRQHAADREAHELPPDGLRFHRRGPALVIVARGETADLAARSLRHRVRRREHDVVDRRADQADGKLVDPAPDLGVARRVDLARLGEHYDAFGPARRVHAAEHRHAAAPDAGDAADRFLELVGADVASAADDDVLFTAGDVEVAFGQVGAIAGVHPFAVEQSLRRLGIAVVAAGRRRAAELQLTFAAVGKRG